MLAAHPGSSSFGGSLRLPCVAGQAGIGVCSMLASAACQDPASTDTCSALQAGKRRQPADSPRRRRRPLVLADSHLAVRWMQKSRPTRQRARFHEVSEATPADPAGIPLRLRACLRVKQKLPPEFPGGDKQAAPRPLRTGADIFLSAKSRSRRARHAVSLAEQSPAGWAAPPRTTGHRTCCSTVLPGRCAAVVRERLPPAIRPANRSCSHSEVHGDRVPLSAVRPEGIIVIVL